MSLLLFIFLGEMLLLFILSQKTTTLIFRILYSIFNNERTTWAIVTFIFLPGTVVHEFSHLIVAEVLRVRTGELSFTPQIENKSHGQTQVKAGYLKIANTDPLRRFLIGFAPVVFGLITSLVIIWFFEHFWPDLSLWWQKALFVSGNGYLLFAVSSSMFSSKADMEGAQYFLPVMLLVLVAIGLTLYVTGVRLSLTGPALEFTLRTLKYLTTGLGIVIGVNFLIYLLNLLFIRGIRSIRN